MTISEKVFMMLFGEYNSELNKSIRGVQWEQIIKVSWSRYRKWWKVRE